MADKIRSVFEFTFARLRAEVQERKDFADKLKKLAGDKLAAIKVPKAINATLESRHQEKTKP